MRSERWVSVGMSKFWHWWYYCSHCFSNAKIHFRRYETGSLSPRFWIECFFGHFSWCRSWALLSSSFQLFTSGPASLSQTMNSKSHSSTKFKWRQFEVCKLRYLSHYDMALLCNIQCCRLRTSFAYLTKTFFFCTVKMIKRLWHIRNCPQLTYQSCSEHS